VANQRRKKTIPALEGLDGLVENTEDMLEVAADFYKKKLFDFEPTLDLHLETDFWGPEEKVSQDGSDILDEHFTEDVKDAVFGSYFDGACSRWFFFSCLSKILRDHQD
jgi:hypothetical protein